jgi:hypothetical protein
MSTTAGKVIPELDVLGLFVRPIRQLAGISQKELKFANGGLPGEHLLFSLLCEDKPITNEILATAPLAVTRGLNDELLLTPEPAKTGFGPIAITKSAKSPAPAKTQDVTDWLFELYHRRCTLLPMKTRPPVPLAVLSYASLLILNEALTVPLTAEALEANLVVQTESPFDEIAWSDSIKIDKILFSVGDALGHPRIKVDALPWRDKLDSGQISLRDYLTAKDGTLILGRFLTATSDGALKKF